jgi:hypothetical protein
MFEFSSLYSKQLILTFCSGEGFGSFLGNGIIAKIPAEIKPPLICKLILLLKESSPSGGN